MAFPLRPTCRCRAIVMLSTCLLRLVRPLALVRKQTVGPLDRLTLMPLQECATFSLRRVHVRTRPATTATVAALLSSPTCARRGLCIIPMISALYRRGHTLRLVEVSDDPYMSVFNLLIAVLSRLQDDLYTKLLRPRSGVREDLLSRCST